MKPPVPSLRAAFSPSGTFEAVPATTVQQAMRQWFECWGRPQQLQFDHGQPWTSGNCDLPSFFELWLVGLGISVVWSRPHHPQDNGKVERSHRTLQAWSAPTYCRSLQQLQQSVDRAIYLQRQLYPQPDGQTRWQQFPALAQPQRPYRIAQEPQLWSLQRVYHYLEQWQWQRKVDSSGRISLYNRNYPVARACANQPVWVHFEANSAAWVMLDATGQEVGRSIALEINPTTICQLQLHRSRAKHRQSSQPSSDSTLCPP
jgi:hypothetical protein